jgi:hypothetical protein
MYIALITILINNLPNFMKNFNQKMIIIKKGLFLPSIFLMLVVIVFCFAHPKKTIATVNLYGNYWRMTDLGELDMNDTPSARKVSIRFKAAYSGNLSSMVGFWGIAKGYGGGTGGIISCQVQTDDGSSQHLPSGNVLGGFVLANPATSPFLHPLASGQQAIDPISFSSPVPVTEGNLYHILCTNPDPSPQANWWSLNCIFNWILTSPQQPKGDIEDNALFFYNGSWSNDYTGHYNPIYSLIYSNGNKQGMPYMQRDNTLNIFGNNKIYQSFKVSGSDKTVINVAVSMVKTGNPGPLTVRLETSAGSLVEQGTIPSTAFVTDNRNPLWGIYTFTTPRTLVLNTSYRVIFSTTGDSSNYYSTWVVQTGNSYGLDGDKFIDTQYPYYTNNGSTWIPVVNLSNNYDDMMMYFSLTGGLTSSDITPPIRANGSPPGIISSGTSQTTISLSTNENAICKYSTSAGVTYASMTGTFSTTGSMNHSTAVTGMTDGKNYNYYVKCKDAAGNANSDDYTISFTVAQYVDITPPVISNGLPNGNLAVNTTSAKLSVTTDEKSTCHYSVNSGISYDSMAGIFTTDGSTAHSVALSGLSLGNSYKYYVKCRDLSGNVSSGDYLITFSILDVVLPNISINSPGNNATISATTSISASVSDNVGVSGVQFKLDGKNLGQEDTVSPFLLAWNTKTVSNGSHTISAVARDAAGNVSESDPIIVNVNNVSPAPIAETLSVSLWASPSSGTAPLNYVSLTASVSGTSQGPVSYTIYCNRTDSGTNITLPASAEYPSSSNETLTSYYVCSYKTPGTYTAKVIVRRGNAPAAESRTAINVTASRIITYKPWWKKYSASLANETVNSSDAEVDTGIVAKYYNYSFYATLANMAGVQTDELSIMEAEVIFDGNRLVKLNRNHTILYQKAMSPKVKTINLGKLDNQSKYAISYFIKYGSPTTRKIGENSRTAALSSFINAFQKVPENIEDWQDVIKIANGRQTQLKSQIAEDRGKAFFKQIYSREPNLQNIYDLNAVMIISYGLSSPNVNIISEKKSMITFVAIFKRTPQSTDDWNIIKAIAYSGAKK